MDATQLNRPHALSAEQHAAVASLVVAAATQLTDTFAMPLRLIPVATFTAKPQVIRCQVLAAADELLATVVIKQAALLSHDAQRAEAELGVVAGRLGAMHAATARHHAQYDHLRDNLGPRDAAMHPRYARYVATSIDGLHRLVRDAGVDVPAALTVELQALSTTLATHGPFVSLTHGDPCPLNWHRHDGTLQLIDWEWSTWAPALLDGTHGRMLFPTYGFAQNIPQPVIEEMEQHYRAALLDHCPAAVDDGAFAQASAEACAFWLVFCLLRDLPAALTAGEEPARTAAQLMVARLQAFLGIADRTAQFPALRRVADQLITQLRTIWSTDVEALAYYPAFRASSSPPHDADTRKSHADDAASA